MFLIIFTIILITLNIYCFINKKYLYLFFPCMLFLPEYYGLDFSNSLPIITATRIMFIVFYLYVFINKKRPISLKNAFSDFPKLYMFLFGYFALRIISNLYYITTYTQATKTIFSLLFEQLGLIIAISLLHPSREETNKIIKSVVFTAAVLFVIGIFESYTSIRLFDALYTVQREIANEHRIRLGLMRATTTLGLPVIFGNMCIMILPLIFYLYSYSKEKKYLCILLLDLFATIHSGSRADVLFFIAIVGFYFIIRLIFRAEIAQFLKDAILICGLAALIMITLSFSNQYSKYFYEGSAKSVLNEFGFSFNIDDSAPEGVDGYGGNVHGVSSRTFQFTGIQYAFSKNPLFGLGTGALANDQVHYNGWGEWVVYHTYDMGIVEILISEGLIGLLGYLSLFIFIAIMILPKLSSLKENPSEIPIILLPCAYLLSTLSTANLQGFLFFIVIVCILYFGRKSLV